MPSIIREEVPSKKRKRLVADGDANALSRTKVKKAVASQDAAQIKELEAGITESQKNLNNIATLLALARKEIKAGRGEHAAVVALCRVFCRLLVDGRLARSNASSEKELAVIEWLRARYTDYQKMLLGQLQEEESSVQLLVLSLSMQLLREEVSSATNSAESIWKTGLFAKIVTAVLSTPVGSTVCQEYVDKFVQPYDDVRHYTFMSIAQLLNTTEKTSSNYERIRNNALSLLSALQVVDSTAPKLNSLFCEPAEKAKPIQVTAHRKQAQQAWLALVSSGLEKHQRKNILGLMTYKVVPWFQNVELLMDFLTDSYNEGGATSLLSLSGLFYLMQEKNLDYPEFYTKLYSLLDSNILHSKHRSRFFRLMNTFMSSTHLPAAMVASFIKRLSRLALDGPPAGIVAVVPWIYNMLRSHPTCTFMIHRVPRTAEERKQIEDSGMHEPFVMEEQDPIDTHAIDSCLWELVTLQSHYHPNVASLARIISEQFTKRSYNLDDFLDHSYISLIETELDKDLKRAPVVEFEIPKKIFTTSEGDATLEKLMLDVFETS